MKRIQPSPEAELYAQHLAEYPLTPLPPERWQTGDGVELVKIQGAKVSIGSELYFGSLDGERFLGILTLESVDEEGNAVLSGSSLKPNTKTQTHIRGPLFVKYLRQFSAPKNLG